MALVRGAPAVNSGPGPMPAYLAAYLGAQTFHAVPPASQAPADRCQETSRYQIFMILVAEYLIAVLINQDHGKPGVPVICGAKVGVRQKCRGVYRARPDSDCDRPLLATLLTRPDWRSGALSCGRPSNRWPSHRQSAPNIRFSLTQQAQRHASADLRVRDGQRPPRVGPVCFRAYLEAGSGRPRCGGQPPGAGRSGRAVPALTGGCCQPASARWSWRARYAG